MLMSRRIAVFAGPEGRQGGVMDFIERIFGLSPDGGSGLLELAVLATITAWIVARVMARRRVRVVRDPSGGVTSSP